MTIEPERLAELLDVHGLTRIEYEHGDLRIVMERTPLQPQPVPQLQSQQPTLHAGNPGGVETTAAAGATATAATAAPPHPQTSVATSPPVVTPDTSPATPEAPATVMVSAPLVGLVYRSREPGAAPFVERGQKVDEGDVLCIIEAMKLFNEITAPCTGTVDAILFEDGTLAEYGAPLISLLHVCGHG
jgi:acetyl-CoA carboxylase biotin carboxyl carrier protein